MQQKWAESHIVGSGTNAIKHRQYCALQFFNVVEHKNKHKNTIYTHKQKTQKIP